jgi:hypothetical protein
LSRGGARQSQKKWRERKGKEREQKSRTESKIRRFNGAAVAEYFEAMKTLNGMLGIFEKFVWNAF